jgi:molybdate transport system substrate-binding protein
MCRRFDPGPAQSITRNALVRLILRVFAAAVVLIGVVAHAGTIQVGAAISLREGLSEISKAYESSTGDHVKLNFGASGQLAAQVINGAPMDVFVSAANAQVDQLIAAGACSKDTRRVIARNQLVLIAPLDSDLSSFKSLATVKKLALGEPKTVPAGQYATQVLKALKLTDQLKDRIVYGASVRQVLEYVQRGEVDAGIVYRTDAQDAGDKVKLVAAAESSWHEAIEYPAVMLNKSEDPAAAKRFLEFLCTDQAQRILRKHGFDLPPAPATAPAK